MSDKYEMGEGDLHTHIFLGAILFLLHYNSTVCLILFICHVVSSTRFGLLSLDINFHGLHRHSIKIFTMLRVLPFNQSQALCSSSLLFDNGYKSYTRHEM